MLGRFAAMPTLATSDLDKARKFYEGVLGLEVMRVENEGVVFAAGGGQFLVYPSAFAGTNKSTAMSFQLPGDVFDQEISELKSKSITLDTFDYEDAVWEDGVMTVGELRGAWFRDPDGNIISVETHPDVT